MNLLNECLNVLKELENDTDTDVCYFAKEAKNAVQIFNV